MFNPNDEKYAKQGFKVLPSGDKVFGVTGFERFTSRKGNNCLRIRFTCVDDLAEGEFNGVDTLAVFALSDNAIWKFAELCKALGVQESFSLEDDESLDDVLTQSYFVGEVEVEKYVGRDDKERTRANVNTYSIYGGKSDPAWEKTLGDGTERHEKYMDKAGERAERASAHAPQSGGGSSEQIPF